MLRNLPNYQLGMNFHKFTSIEFDFIIKETCSLNFIKKLHRFTNV